MKCQSCTKLINPEWQHSINNNICPFCGELLMATEIKDGLATLGKVIDALKEHEDYLEDYLFGRGYVKQDSTRAQEFTKNPAIKTYRKPVVDENGEEVDKGLLVQKSSDEKTTPFFNRAEAGKFLNKAADMREKAAKVKNLLGGGGIINLDTDAEDLGSEYDDVMEDEYADIPPQLLPPTEGGVSAQAERQMLAKARASRNKFRSGQGGFRRDD